VFDLRRLRLNEITIEEVGIQIFSGALVVYPTDTVYGIGCDPFNPDAVDRLKTVKKRGKKPLPLLVGSLEIAERFGSFPPQAVRLAETYWPGPLTLVVKKKIGFPSSVTSSTGLLGLRVPNHPFLLKLLLLIKTPIIGTSGNISGAPPATTADEAEEYFGSRVDLILDGGKSRTKSPSTVVEASNNRLRLLRKGLIPFDEIMATIRSQENTRRTERSSNNS